MPEPYRTVSALPTGTAFSRYLMVKAAARGDVYTELTLAEKFKDSPTVHATLSCKPKPRSRPGTTTDATWAGPLAVYGIAGEALTLLRGASIIGALEVENAARAVSDEGRRARRAAARAARGSGKGSARRWRRPRTTRSARKPTRPARSSCCRTNS